VYESALRRSNGGRLETGFRFGQKADRREDAVSIAVNPERVSAVLRALVLDAGRNCG
jgi:hypothetical protein